MWNTGSFHNETEWMRGTNEWEIEDLWEEVNEEIDEEGSLEREINGQEA